MKRSLPFCAALAALCAALLVSPGCGTKQEINKIGAVLPLSGGNETGNQHLHGLTLAVEELNAASPSVQYQLITEDEGASPESAAAAFTKLLTVDKVAVVVTATDMASLAIAPKAEQDFVPLFGNCEHPLIVTMFRDLFRNYPGTALEIRATLAFAAQSRGASAIALIYSDDPYGKSVLETVKNEAAERGVTLAGQEPFDPSQTDPSSSVNAILAAKPDVVLVYGPGEAGMGVVVALRRAGFAGDVCVSRLVARDQSGKLAARALAGCYFAATKFELAGDPVFAGKYRARFKAEPTLNVAAAYDAMMIIAKAADIKRAEEISLTNALKKLGDYSGALGPYRYADREWSPQLSIIQYQESQVP